MLRNHIRLIVGCAILLTLAALAAGVSSFIEAQRELGRRTVLLEQERARQDSLREGIARAEARAAQARESEARTLARANRADARARAAEARFAGYVAQVDTTWLRDTASVPVVVLQEFRDSAVVAITACSVARDSLRLAVDTTRTRCEMERARGDSLALLVESHRRADSLNVPAPRKGRVRDIGFGAVLMAGVLKLLGVF